MDHEVTPNDKGNIALITISIDSRRLKDIFQSSRYRISKNINDLLAKFYRIPKSYKFWKFVVETTMYFSLTLLFITSIKIAAYLPVVTKYNFKILGSLAESKGGLNIFKISVDNPANVYALTHDLGLNYSPFLFSVGGILICTIVLLSFFSAEKKLIGNLKRCLLFIITLFGMLITLFSIWGV